MSPWPVTNLNGEVNCVATSGNGQIVIAGTYYFNVTASSKPGTYAYDANGTELWKDVTNPPLVGGDQGFYWVAVSRDGKWAASGGGRHKIAPRTSLIGYVNAYEVATGTKTTLLSATNGGVNIVALSGDGSFLVAGADAAYVFARTGATFAAPVVLTNQVGATDSVVAVAISDDGTWMVYGTSAGKVVLVPNKAVPGVTGPVVWSAPSNHYVKSIAMATDGSGFTVATTNRANATPIECNAYFFNLNSSWPKYFPATQAPVWTWPLAGCTGTLSIAVNANGSRVAAEGNIGNGATTSGLAFFFDTQSGAQLWSPPRTTVHGPNSISVDGAGSLVALADGFQSPGQFYLFDALGATVPINGLLPNQPGVVSWSIQISADGTSIAAGGDDGKVYRYATATTGPTPSAPTNLRINS
jgi:WD40 repeat protein